MALDFPQVVPQVEEMSQAAALRAAELEAKIPGLLEALAQASQIPPDELRAKILRAGDRWPGALPTGESIDDIYPLPPHPERLTILGADGSQIYPDRHATALYYLINIGSIRIDHGSGEPPQVASRPRVMYDEADLYGENEGLISSALIDGQRDVAEIGELARLAADPSVGPTLALLDNGLLLWLALQSREQSRGEISRLLSEYLENLGRLKQAGAAVAGFVDRPRSANVIALLHLARLPADQIDSDTLRANPLRGLTDRALFARRLRPGERSARFVNASPVNNQFETAGHSIEFFYLNCGPRGQIARVEIPRWVGEDPRLMDIVHAGIIEQCRTPEGFPYVLVRAHELAVVTQDDRRALDQMLSEALLQRGLMPSLSQKAVTKQWTGARRRHKL
jgi:hypothetical protein